MYRLALSAALGSALVLSRWRWESLLWDSSVFPSQGVCSRPNHHAIFGLSLTFKYRRAAFLGVHEECKGNVNFLVPVKTRLSSCFILISGKGNKGNLRNKNVLSSFPYHFFLGGPCKLGVDSLMKGESEGPDGPGVLISMLPPSAVSRGRRIPWPLWPQPHIHRAWVSAPRSPCASTNLSHKVPTGQELPPGSRGRPSTR